MRRLLSLGFAVFSVSFALWGISLLFVPAPAQAASAENCTTQATNFFGMPTWYKYLKPEFVNGGCELQFEMPRDFGLVALAVAEILLRIGGFVAVGFVVYGGIQYILSQGDSGKSVAARHTIINALVGIVFASIATFIVNIVGRNLAP